MQPKKVSESRYTMVHRVFISELNSKGSMHGGFLLRYLDEAAAVTAVRHARCPLVTAEVQQAKYIAPIYHGEILLFHCSVNLVGTSSMEVGVRVEAENHLTGEIRHTNTAYLTFVALDEEHKPSPLPPLVPETDEDRRRMADAARRMALSRMERRLPNGLAPRFQLERIPGSFALCRLAPDTPMPSLPELCWQFGGAFASFCRTAVELSFILPENALACLPEGACIESDFACLRVVGSFDMNTTGLISSLSFMLAAAEIPVFISSTFTTAFLLIRSTLLDKAVHVLLSAGHGVSL